MAKESYQDKLDRVNPPYVQIRFDVEVGGAIRQLELPFAVGVLSDLSGHRKSPLPKLKQRKFVQVDRDNLDKFMESIAPRLELRVKDTLSKHLAARRRRNGEGAVNAGKDTTRPTGAVDVVKDAAKPIGGSLVFKSLVDLEPLGLVQQIGPLKTLYKVRERLREFRSEITSNERLEETLQQLVENTEQLVALRKERMNRLNATKESAV